MSSRKGYILATVLVLVAALMIIVASLSYLLLNQKIITRKNEEKVTNLQIAEAGVNYYLWHLAHDPEDYTDGTGLPGPYTHEYKNNLGQIVGSYSLTITPPGEFESYVKVAASGKLSSSNETKTVEATLGIPSFSQFAWLINQRSRFGATSETLGLVHCNADIEFDGHAHKLVSSANANPGVWGSGTFDEGVSFPVPAIDFQQVSADLSDLKTQATAEGKYIATKSGTNTRRNGYRIVFHAGGYDLYQVNTESRTGGITNQAFLGSYNAPHNGIIFVEDDLWLEGTYDSRLTVAAAYFPDNAGTRPNITIVNNLLYTTKDGSVSLGLVSQGHIWEAYYCPNNLEIDAAVLAQNGCFGYDFANGSSGVAKGTLTTYGSTTSYLSTANSNPICAQQYGNAGFHVRNYSYDSHLFFSPPPSFPTTGKYTILSWREK